MNIALPSAQAALGFYDADRTWVVTAYTCTLAGLLLLGGRVADRVGRRRAFLGGLVGFAARPHWPASPPSFEVLVAGRALQGVFAAVLDPDRALAGRHHVLRPEGAGQGVRGVRRGGLRGAAVGLLVGGVLTEYAGWRWCLYVNVIVAVAASVAGRAVLPHDRGYAESKIDPLSGGLVTGGLMAIVLGCAQAASHGWTSGQVLVPGLVGLGLLALFLVRQARMATPLLPLWLLRDRNRAGAYVAVAVSVVGSFGMFLMLTYHFQVVLGWSPVQAGLAFLPLSAAVSASAYGLGSRLLPRVAPRALMAPGLAVAAAGLFLLDDAQPTSDYLTLILPAEVLLGTGMGWCSHRPSASSRAESRRGTPVWLPPPPTPRCRSEARSAWPS